MASTAARRVMLPTTQKNPSWHPRSMHVGHADPPNDVHSNALCDVVHIQRLARPRCALHVRGRAVGKLHGMGEHAPVPQGGGGCGSGVCVCTCVCVYVCVCLCACVGRWIGGCVGGGGHELAAYVLPCGPWSLGFRSSVQSAQVSFHVQGSVLHSCCQVFLVPSHHLKRSNVLHERAQQMIARVEAAQAF